MNFINQRKNQGNNSTIGDIYEKMDSGEWKWFSYIVEDDAVGEKGDKRIPAGFYELKIHNIVTPKTEIFRKQLPWFNFFIEVTGIPGFSLVFWHPGNSERDTEGCQTPNYVMGNNNIGPITASNSRDACRDFYAKVYPYLESGGKCFYEVRDEIKLWKP
jgi:hypothetical protein